jgi:triphosphoribosyl-dephospho-CoA synthase
MIAAVVDTDQGAVEAEIRGRRVELAFVDACLLDVLAVKPGNVGVHAAGHGMEAVDFVRSARAAAPAIAAQEASVGERVHRAVAATRAAVGTNTNLGIVLLAAPLAQAALRAQWPLTRPALAASLAQVLADLTVRDARLAFEAICLASPGGLGEAPRHDVRTPAQVTLLEAMREAANRDSIARQYVSAYADVLDAGLAKLALARQAGFDYRWAATLVYLEFLSAHPDSHVARKLGSDAAEALRGQACARLEAVRQVEHPRLLRAQWREWDAALKARGLNPGTSADLTVATLFAGFLLAVDR